MDQINLMLVDDHELLRDALKCIFSAQADMKVVSESGTAAAALEQASNSDAAVILLDIKLPDRSGLSIMPELRVRCPGAQIIIVSMHDEPSYLRSALAAGALGYVVKTSGAAILLEAVRAVHCGESYIDPSMRSYEVNDGLSLLRNAPVSRLSERERQVLFWLAQGMRYQVIADKLGVSVKTIETYRSRLTAKLGFKDRSDMMRFAIETGLLNRSNLPLIDCQYTLDLAAQAESKSLKAPEKRKKILRWPFTLMVTLNFHTSLQRQRTVYIDNLCERCRFDFRHLKTLRADSAG